MIFLVMTTLQLCNLYFLGVSFMKYYVSIYLLSFDVFNLVCWLCQRLLSVKLTPGGR